MSVSKCWRSAGTIRAAAEARVERSSSTKKFKGKTHRGKVKASGRTGKKAAATKKSSGQKKTVKKKTAKKS